MPRRLLVALLLLWPTAVLACSVDADCKAGSTCLKASSSASGICIEGIGASNVTDQAAPPDPNGTNGRSCSFDSDCGAGSRCMKDYATGVCMLGR
jgi:hypothetical protein